MTTVLIFIIGIPVFLLVGYIGNKIVDKGVFVMRRTYAYNSIILGFLIGLLVYAKVKQGGEET